MGYIYTILLVSLTAIGLSFLAYRVYLHSQKEKPSYLENNEFNDSKQTKKANLLFFYADWCKHCQTSKPIWENVKKDTEFLRFNVNFVDIDGDDNNNENLMKNYNVKEYPTIILERDDKKYIFDAELETETLFRFMSSVYNVN